MSRKGCVSNYVGEVSVIYPQDREIRNEDAPAYQTELQELIAKAKHRKVLLNFENVDYLGSATYGILMKFGQQCRTQDVILKFCGFRKVPKEGAVLFQLHRLADVVDSEADAISSFEKKKGWFG